MNYQPPAPETRPAKRGIGTAGIVTAVVGGVVLLGLGASAVFAMGFSSQRADAPADHATSATPVNVEGVTSLDLNVGVADLRLEYDDVAEATLQAAGGSAQGWSLRRDGDELQVRAPKSGSGFCFFGVCPSTRGQHVTATLTLPKQLAAHPIDADIRVGVGSVHADGNFGELSVKVDVGDANIGGTAQDLDLEIGVGTFAGEFEGAKTVEAEVSLGDLDLVLNGAPPTDVKLEVTSGVITLAVPSAEYDVVVARSIGDVSSTLRNVAGAPNRIYAKADIGEISLHETR